ncbi:MAG: hypothetical protein ACJ71K_20205 [Nitrososphaeraceae archaeon]|jgi:hypothetical protein
MTNQEVLLCSIHVHMNKILFSLLIPNPDILYYENGSFHTCKQEKDIKNNIRLSINKRRTENNKFTAGVSSL